MFNVRLACDHLIRWLSLVMSLIVSYLCCTFFHEMSWMRSGTELGQFLKIFLPALTNFGTLSSIFTREVSVH